MIVTENKIIDICDEVLDEKYWEYEIDKIHRSRYLYRNSPFESDDTCNNCDGALCDTCKELIEKAHFEFLITSDDLCEILINGGIPEDVAKELAYNDNCRVQYKNYTLKWPSETILKENHIEFYNKLYTPDEEIISIIKPMITGPILFDNIRDHILNELKIEYKYYDTKTSHVTNQLTMYLYS